MATREEYENLINNSPLFDIDKDASPTLYKTERYNFLTVLTDYYRFCIFPAKSLDSYSMTLMETAVDCIKSYNKADGVFLHYFNKSFKKNLHIAVAKENINKMRSGIKISDKHDKMIRKIIELARSKGLDVNNEAVQEKIASILKMDVETVRELLLMNNNAVGVSSTITGDDGDEVELFDMQANNEQSAEDKLIEESGFCEQIEKIESVFNTLQDRQKRQISMLITVWIIKGLDYNITKTKAVLDNKQILSTEVLDYYDSHNVLPTDKQIASLCGIPPESLSRSKNKFMEKLKNG